MNVFFGKALEVKTKNNAVLQEIEDRRFEQREKIEFLPINSFNSGEDGFYKGLLLTDEDKNAWQSVNSLSMKSNGYNESVKLLTSILFPLEELLREKAEKVEVNSVDEVQEKIFDKLA